MLISFDEKPSRKDFLKISVNAVNIYDGEILLSGVAVLVHPFDVLTTFAVLLKQHFAGAADKTGGKTGGVLMVSIGQVFHLTLDIGIVAEEVLLRDAEGTPLGVALIAQLNCHLRRHFPEFLFQLVLVIDHKSIEISLRSLCKQTQSQSSP